MSVVTISRGTFSGGKALAESLGRLLGFRCIDRDMIVERAAGERVPQQELRSVLEQPPGLLRRASHKRYIYLALIQAALTEEVKNGKAVYHGLAGHLLLRGPALLRVRIIAPLEFRIRMARQNTNMTRSEAIAYIEKMDHDRRKWTKFLYGENWEDPALYDVVINLEHMQIDEAAEVLASALERPTFQFTPECRSEWYDLALAARVRATLAVDPSTSNLELNVESRAGCITISGELLDQADAVRRVAGTVPGTTGLTVRQAASTDELWPWGALSADK